MKLLGSLLKWLVFSIIGLFGLALVWSVFDLPTSISEAKFRKSLYAQVKAEASEIKFENMMPGDWELVCDSHGYGGDLHLKQYNRTYKPVGYPDDGHWGLIFISPDGSYIPVTGYCHKSGIDMDLRGCKARTEAIIYRYSIKPGDHCSRYKSITEAQQAEELGKSLK